jgi:hypothetical protein
MLIRGLGKAAKYRVPSIVRVTGLTHEKGRFSITKVRVQQSVFPAKSAQELRHERLEQTFRVSSLFQAGVCEYAH